MSLEGLQLAPPKGTQVIFIVGANASGKSNFAVDVALKLGGEIISADSRQVYRHLDIGSGKISVQERCGIMHHLIDVVDPGAKYSVHDYQVHAYEALARISSGGNVPIVVGGTGLYVDSLARGYSLVNVPANELLRAQLETVGRGDLLNMLRQSEPSAAEALANADSRRLIRAIEINRAGACYADTKTYDPVLKPLFFGIRWSREALRARIHARLLRRLDGMIDEVSTLLAKGVSRDFFWHLGLEYRFTIRYLDGDLSRDAFSQQLEIAIGQFAKRQMTWFRRNSEIHWLDGESELRVESVLPEIDRFRQIH